MIYHDYRKSRSVGLRSFLRTAARTPRLFVRRVLFELERESGATSERDRAAYRDWSKLFEAGVSASAATHNWSPEASLVILNSNLLKSY